jgi:LPXTG-site transpeptidase (sortase) family protein
MEIIWFVMSLIGWGKPSGEPKTELVSPTPVIKTELVRPVEAKETKGWPEKLIIGSINLEAAIVTVGLDDEGLTPVPEAKNQVSWFKFGAAPGEIGSAVLAGHYRQTDGAGVFGMLPKVKVGEMITIENNDGQTQTFKVEAIKIYDKDKFPTKEIYGSKDGRRLNLITCFGKYDSWKKDYQKRLVVYARRIEV